MWGGGRWHDDIVGSSLVFQLSGSRIKSWLPDEAGLCSYLSLPNDCQWEATCMHCSEPTKVKTLD